MWLFHLKILSLAGLGELANYGLRWKHFRWHFVTLIVTIFLRQFAAAWLSLKDARPATHSPPETSWKSSGASEIISRAKQISLKISKPKVSQTKLSFNYKTMIDPYLHFQNCHFCLRTKRVFRSIMQKRVFYCLIFRFTNCYACSSNNNGSFKNDYRDNYNNWWYRQWWWRKRFTVSLFSADGNTSK